MQPRAVITTPPKIVIFVIYKSDKGGLWKGFCSPYDVTCYAETVEDAKKKLKALVRIYEEGLRKYGYPKHLTLKRLSDPKDRRIFEAVKKHIAEAIQEKIAKEYDNYQSQGTAQETFSLKTPARVTGHYYQPQLA